MTSLEGYEKPWRLRSGELLAEEFPENAFFRMDPNYPKNVKLADSLSNNGLALISQRFKDFLEARKLQNVEYIRVSIINHKGRVAGDDYYIANPYEAQDCLDLDKSEPTYNAIKKSKIMFVEELVIDSARVDPDVELFRVKDFGKPILVRQRLADAIDAESFTSVVWLPTDTYQG